MLVLDRLIGLASPEAGAYSRTSTRRQPDPLQHRRRGNQNACRPKVGEHRQNDGLAAIRGPRRIRTNPKAGPPVVEAKTAKPHKLLQLEQMLAASFGSACILAE